MNEENVFNLLGFPGKLIRDPRVVVEYGIETYGTSETKYRMILLSLAASSGATVANASDWYREQADSKSCPHRV
jgi:hypothetical protein